MTVKLQNQCILDTVIVSVTFAFADKKIAIFIVVWMQRIRELFCCVAHFILFAFAFVLTEITKNDCMRVALKLQQNCLQWTLLTLVS